MKRSEDRFMKVDDFDIDVRQLVRMRYPNFPFWICELLWRDWEMVIVYLTRSEWIATEPIFTCLLHASPVIHDLDNDSAIHLNSLFRKLS